MSGGSEPSAVPERGEIVEYDGAFLSPESPIIPIASESEASVVQATRRVLDEAATEMGREIHWLPIDVDIEAATGAEFLPEASVRRLEQFRLGLIGPLASQRGDLPGREREIHRRFGRTQVCNQFSPGKWHPSPSGVGEPMDLTVFRNALAEVAADSEARIRDRRSTHEGISQASISEIVAGIPNEPAGFDEGADSSSATASLIDTAIDYAFERDRNSMTIAHREADSGGAEGSFLAGARDHLSTEYGDAVIDEETFRSDLQGRFPDEEIVVMERPLAEVLRQLLDEPAQLDVVVTTGAGGRYLSSVAEAVGGGGALTPGLLLPEGLLIAYSQPQLRARRDRSGANPIGMLLSSCLLLEYIGWEDVVTQVRRGISKTLADGFLPADLDRAAPHGDPITADAFVTALLQRVTSAEGAPGAGGRGTSAAERDRIRTIIAGVYNLVFEDKIAPSDIELNQLFGADEEADVYLPEVGINFYYWRRWSAERRLEVLLHELAHIEQADGERDHGSKFYDRLVELIDVAAEWEPELEALFAASIDFDRLRHLVVQSVHEETIEPDLESVEERKRFLCSAFDIDLADHE